MKILYFAKHGQHDNADEDAISYALETLGHTVTRIQETDHQDSPDMRRASEGHDFCLFHKVEAVSVTCPRVFWHFDLMEYDEREKAAETDDPKAQQLANTWYQRGLQRRQWAQRVEPHCLVCFYTDGDWAAKDVTGKRVHLCQGADERVAGFGTPDPDKKWAPILFTGMTNHGVRRMKNVQSLESRYGGQFQVFGHHPRYRKHGRELADLFASVKIVVAPEGPSTDGYWSNRIYLTTGFGGFMLHPYCLELTNQYPVGLLPYYRDQQELYAQIDYYLDHDEERERVRGGLYLHTMAHHTYRHRAEELVRIVKERL